MSKGHKALLKHDLSNPILDYGEEIGAELSSEDSWYIQRWELFSVQGPCTGKLEPSALIRADVYIALGFGSPPPPSTLGLGVGWYL